MTAKEKAEDLILKYSILAEGRNEIVKQCALIAVEEILLANPTWFVDQMKSTHKYWEEVKKEIEQWK
jgi:glycyl-tRNA synthetase (class II)